MEKTTSAQWFKWIAWHLYHCEKKEAKTLGITFRTYRTLRETDDSKCGRAVASVSSKRSLCNSIDSDFSWLTAEQLNDQQHLQLAIDFGHQWIRYLQR